MFSIGGRRSGAAGWFLALFCLFMLMGCRSELFPTTLRVEPGVVSDMRGLGEVLAATQRDPSWDGETQVTEVLIIDVGTPASNATTTNWDAMLTAESTAIDRLRSRGWLVVGDKDRDATQMESSRWEDTVLSLLPLAFADTDDFDPQLIEAIKDARARGRSEALVALEASPKGSW